MPLPMGEEMKISEYAPCSVRSDCSMRFIPSSMDRRPSLSSISIDSFFWRSRNTQSELLSAAVAPMIMLTAEATAEAMQQCKAAGMKAFLTKPINPEMLFKTIAALTGTGISRADDAGIEKFEANQPEEGVIDESVLIGLDKHAYSPQFVVDVVDSFESDMRDLIERLDAAVKSEDWHEIAEIRHAIKGTAQGSGAAVIATLIKKLQSLRAVAPVERDEQIAELRARFATTREAMRKFLARRAMDPSANATRALG